MSDIGMLLAYAGLAIGVVCVLLAMQRDWSSVGGLAFSYASAAVAAQFTDKVMYVAIAFGVGAIVGLVGSMFIGTALEDRRERKAAMPKTLEDAPAGSLEDLK